MKNDSNAKSASRSSFWSDRSAWLLFLSAVFGTCFVALMVQLVLLPTYLPSQHAGHGMLVGGDSEGMHSTAAALAQRIRTEGWSAWELRPAGNAPTGIAAAIYVYLTEEPYVLVPLNALVHSAGGLFIYLMARNIFQHKLAAVAAAIPFLVFPSAASWYAQIHKDGIFALGIVLYAYGWMFAFRLDFWRSAVSRIVSFLVPVAFGLFLIWLVRPYTVILMQLAGVVIMLFGMMLVTAWWRSGALSGSRSLLAVFLFVVIPVMTVVVKPSDSRVESWKEDVIARELTMHYMPTTCVLERGTYAWVDKLSSTVAGMRDFFISGYPNAKSNMDPEFVPGTVCNLLVYVPRALQVGFLAPFPNAWLAEGSIAVSTLMRRVISFEMIVTYLALLFLPLILWDNRRKPEFWFIMGFFVLMTTIHVYLVPNLGTLYRMRYAFLTGAVGLVIAGGFQRFLSRRAGPQAAVHC